MAVLWCSHVLRYGKNAIPNPSIWNKSVSPYISSLEAGCLQAHTCHHSCLHYLINFRYAPGGWGWRQLQWHLLGEQHKCQQHSGFARRLVPQCGWAQDWLVSRMFLFGEQLHSCGKSWLRGSRKATFQASTLSVLAVWHSKCYLTSQGHNPSSVTRC